jgi:type IV secretion system protein VirB10
MNIENPQTTKESATSKIKKLRKEVLIAGIAFIAILTAFIVINIAKSAKKPAKVQTDDNVRPANSAVAWYHEQKMARPKSESPAIALIHHNGNASQAVVTVDTTPVDQAAMQAEMTAKRQAEAEAKQAQKQAEQQRLTDMKAAISSNQVTPQNNGNNSASSNGVGSSGKNPIANNLANANSQDNSGLPKDDQNMTAEKRKFVSDNSVFSNDVLPVTKMAPIAKYVLSFGTLIPARLDKQINSDIPGQIYGHITRDVYDSRTHSVLLIPAGSQLVGRYDTAIAYGQDRLLVAWQRVNFPNGEWLDLQGMGGADPAGAGFGDIVDNHYWRIFGATFLTSVLAAGAQLSQPQQTNALQSPGVGQTIGQSVGTQISQTGTMLMQKNINIQPTIIIRAGFDFNVEVNKDIVFNDSYTANPNK